jgi:hypothetical protein
MDNCARKHLQLLPFKRVAIAARNMKDGSTFLGDDRHLSYVQGKIARREPCTMINFKIGNTGEIHLSRGRTNR